VTKLEYNPAKAKQLLDDAGWKPNAQGIREKNGQQLAFGIVNISGDVERQQIAEIAVQQWKAIGVQAENKPVDAATFVKVMQSGDFAVAYGFWGGGPDPDSMLSTWFYSKGNNWQRLNLQNLDALIDQGRTTLDQNKRKDIYGQAQEVIAQEAPNIFVYARIFFDGVKKKAHNFKPVSGGGVNTWNAYEWWIEP
jgi:peptide/nickel transport system substrate-binding protein